MRIYGVISFQVKMRKLKPPSNFTKNSDGFKELIDFFVFVVESFFEIQLASWQVEIAREIIYRVIMRKRHTIVISICRQVGKTEIVTYCTWFLTYFFPLIEGEKFRCVITAPEKGTGAEVFDRTKMLFDICQGMRPDDFRFKQKNLDSIILWDGSRIDNFGLFKGYANREGKKTTKEGRTYHMTVRDEMHMGDDEIYRDEVEPAMSTTGGVDIFIGNGGYRACKAKDLIEGGTTSNVTVFKFDFDVMKVRVAEEYERTGNEMWKRWLDSQLHYIEENGEESDVVQKNLYLEWLVTVGNFVLWEKFKTFRREEEPKYFKSTIADVGIDWGKESDETIATVTDYQVDIRTWMAFYGEYPDQVDEIAAWLQTIKEKHNVTVRNVICDSTGSGDPNLSMLKRKVRVPVIGVNFNTNTKDKMAKKGLRAFVGKDPSMTLSYPKNVIFQSKEGLRTNHTNRFETQWRKLEKERTPAGILKFHHPKENGAKDDYCDSFLLSTWKILAVNQTRTYSKRTIG